MCLSRVMFVSPPETNNNNIQSFVLTTECDCVLNKNYSTLKTEKTINPICFATLKINLTNNATIVECEQNKIAPFQFCKLDFKHDGDYTISKHSQTSILVLVLLLCKQLIEHIHNINIIELFSCCLAIIYSYFLPLPVIFNKYKTIKRLCLTKWLICMILQLYWPKTQTRNQTYKNILLERSQNVRGVYPLSKWITTSPKKYPSKLNRNNKNLWT